MRVIEFSFCCFSSIYTLVIKATIVLHVGVKSCSLTIFQLSEKIQTKCVEVPITTESL